MLGKLIKHDFKALSRILLPTNLVILGATILASLGLTFTLRNGMDSISNSPWSDILSAIGGIITVMAIFGVFAAFFFVAIIIFYRFYKSCVDNEGYLTFTLPVSSSNILWSKLLTAFFWILISTAVGLVCLYIFLLFGTASHGVVNYDIIYGVRDFMAEARPYFTGTMFLFIIEVLVLMLVATAANVLQIFLALIIGGTVAQKHKLLAGIGFYFAINFAVGIVSSVIQFIYFRNVDNLVNTEFTPNSPPAVIVAEVVGAVQYIFLPTLILSAVLCVVFFLLANYLTKNRLNLS